MSLNLILFLRNEFEQPKGEGWALFNMSGDFLTCGIERNDEEDIFVDDETAYEFVRTRDSTQHKIAVLIHDLCDELRLSKGWDADARTPPPTTKPSPRVDIYDDCTIWAQNTLGPCFRVDSRDVPDLDFSDDEDLASHVQNHLGFHRVTIERTTKTTRTL